MPFFTPHVYLVCEDRGGGGDLLYLPGHLPDAQSRTCRKAGVANLERFDLAKASLSKNSWIGMFFA